MYFGCEVYVGQMETQALPLSLNHALKTGLSLHSFEGSASLLIDSLKAFQLTDGHHGINTGAQLSRRRGVWLSLHPTLTFPNIIGLSLTLLCSHVFNILKLFPI